MTRMAGALVLAFCASWSFVAEAVYWSGGGISNDKGKLLEDKANWNNSEPSTQSSLGFKKNSVSVSLDSDKTLPRFFFEAGGDVKFDLAPYVLTVETTGVPFKTTQRNATVTLKSGTIDCGEKSIAFDNAGSSNYCTNNTIVVTGSSAVLSAGGISFDYSTNCCFRAENGATVNVPVFSVMGAKNTISLYGVGFPQAVPMTVDGVSGNTLALTNVSLSGSVGGCDGLGVRAGEMQRIILSGNTTAWSKEQWSPFSGTARNSVFEILDGAVFARTNANAWTSTDNNNSKCSGNTMRIAGTGSMLLYDAYVQCGGYADSTTFIVEDGGLVSWTGKNSGNFQVGAYDVTNTELRVRSGGKLEVKALSISQRSGSLNRVSISGTDSSVECSSACFVGMATDRQPVEKTPAAGTNVLAVADSGSLKASFLTFAGSENILALTNGTISVSSCFSSTDKTAIAIPDPNFYGTDTTATTPSVNNHVMIGGSRSLLESTAAGRHISFAQNTDFTFAIPSSGYECAPIKSAGDITFANCGAVHVDATAFIAAGGKAVVLAEAEGTLSVDSASLANFNSSLPSGWKIRVRQGNQLVLSETKGLVLVVQ